MIRMIAALDDKLGIANNNGIPWDIPSDRRYFREKTENSTIVMGYTTYQEFKEPLVNRTNIVVDERNAGVREGFQTTHDVRTYLKSQRDDVWVVGGAKLFAAVLDMADELYLTHIAGDFACTKFFPSFSEMFALDERTEAQSENGYSFYFAGYVRK